MAAVTMHSFYAYTRHFCTPLTVHSRITWLSYRHLSRPWHNTATTYWCQKLSSVTPLYAMYDAHDTDKI